MKLLIDSQLIVTFPIKDKLIIVFSIVLLLLPQITCLHQPPGDYQILVQKYRKQSRNEGIPATPSRVTIENRKAKVKSSLAENSDYNVFPYVSTGI